MIIVILTVNEKGDKLYEKLKTLVNYDIIIKKFPLVCKNYGTDTNQETSDSSSCIKKSIWDNTLECIKYGLQYDDYVCVLQDDFIPYDNINDNIINCENFIKHNQNTDLVFLSSHPGTIFENTVNKNIAKVKSKQTGWESVIFTKSFLDKVKHYTIKIPYGVHSDVYFNKYYKNNKINAYMHIPSSGRQSTELFMRKLQYNILYDWRYNCKYGDPLLYICYIVFIFIFIFILIVIFKKLRK
tara:strand:- start:431 stop:1153 length:723 start_codon:yes stop_codon:yes gene_type:complete